MKKEKLTKLEKKMRECENKWKKEARERGKKLDKAIAKLMRDIKKLPKRAKTR